MHYLVCLLTVYQSCSKPLSEGSLPVVSIITRFKNSYFWKSPSASSVKFFIQSSKTRLSGQMCAADRCSALGVQTFCSLPLKTESESNRLPLGCHLVCPHPKHTYTAQEETPKSKCLRQTCTPPTPHG